MRGRIKNPEGRAKLKAIQMIVNFTTDDEVDEMVEELRAHLETLPKPERIQKEKLDRKERGGRNREE